MTLLQSKLKNLYSFQEFYSNSVISGCTNKFKIYCKDSFKVNLIFPLYLVLSSAIRTINSIN